MKKTVYKEGGRPFYDDDLETIQGEGQAAATAVLVGLGRDCIVSGCTVSSAGGRYTIAPGLVWVGGELLRFMGASGVVLPASLVPSGVSVVYDERAYETGISEICIQEEFAAVGAAGVGVPLHPAGGLTLQHVLQAAHWEIGDVKWGALSTAHYDATGLGLPGTPAWGWGLCNGQGGRYDFRGKFVASYDPERPAYAMGKEGGAETVTLVVNEIPTHTHTSNNLIVDSRGNGEAEFRAAYTASTGAKGKNIKIEAAGGGQAHENRPPYFVLAAKQRVEF